MNKAGLPTNTNKMKLKSILKKASSQHKATVSIHRQCTVLHSIFVYTFVVELV